MSVGGDSGEGVAAVAWMRGTAVARVVTVLVGAAVARAPISAGVLLARGCGVGIISRSCWQAASHKSKTSVTKSKRKNEEDGKRIMPDCNPAGTIDN